MSKKKIIHYSCEGRIEKSVPWDPRDVFFYPTIALMRYSYIPAPIVFGDAVFGPCFVMQNGGLFSSFTIIFVRKTKLVDLIYSCYGCYGSASLPSDVVGWFAVRDCGTSWLYLLTFWNSC